MSGSPVSFDWGAVGATLAAIGAVATGAVAWWQGRQKAKAQTRADIAESDAERNVADAQSTVYKLLSERLSTLEREVKELRAELGEERRHSRRLELHIWKLEQLMRAAGLEPPEFDGKVQLP